MIDPISLRRPAAETQLLDYIQRVGEMRDGRMAVHIHLSQLSPAYRNTLFMRIAAESFGNYLSGVEGQLFLPSNGDILFVAKNVTPTLLKSGVEKVRLLFSQDPLLEAILPDGEAAFYTLYDLETDDYGKLLSLAAQMAANADKQRVQSAQIEMNGPSASEPIEPELLAKLEQALATVDVSNISRRQLVCTLADEATPPKPMFEEIFVSIEDLRAVVTPGVDLISNTWLFRYLTHTLDERVMRMLIRDGSQTKYPFSINLNVSSVLSPAFQKFEQTITPQLRGRLVIELNKLDVFSDMGTFLFVRDYLRDHGFRLCLDGLTHHTLPYYDRQKLGFDLVKLYWTPSALDTMLPSQIPEIRHIIMDTGQAHTILCRCDDAHAVDTGKDLGIVMFQGRYIDKLLSAPPPPHRVRV